MLHCGVIYANGSLLWAASAGQAVTQQSELAAAV